MPASSRSSVDLPAPLCPTRPTRSPSRSDSVMSCSASMIGTRWSMPILPPTLPSTAFFSDRVQTSMLTMSRPHSYPVGHSGSVVAHDHQGQRPPEHRDTADGSPAPPVHVLTGQRRAHDLHEVV